MADFYTDLGNDATSILKEFNQGTILLIRPSTAPASPNTPWTPGVKTETSYVLDAVVGGVKSKFIDETLVKASDLQVTCAAKATLNGSTVAIVPSTDDIVSIDGKRYEIKRVVQVPAAGTPIIFELFVAA